MKSPRILLVGGSGYIGGSVLTELQALRDQNILPLTLSALVRSETQAAVLRTHDVQPILFQGLEDTAFLRRIASEHDIVINCAISYNVPAAEALVKGLGDRHHAQSDFTPFYIHTSGTSSIAVSAADTQYGTQLPPPYSDAEDNIHNVLQRLESITPYPQRTTDLAVISTGIATSIPTYIVMPPLVYGLGSGHFNRLTVQEPAIINKARKLGYTPVLAGSGHGRHNHIHITDLARLYAALVGKLLSSESNTVPSGERGIFFAEAGEHTWLEISQGVARTGVELGVLASGEVRELSPEQWAVGGSGSNTLPAVPEIIAHSMGSHGLTEAVLARRILGWHPQMGDDAWKNHFLEEFKAACDLS